jgi:hypothetical protein
MLLNTTIILSFTLAILRAAPSHSFASWFMAACLTDLWDPSEAMMGHHIVPFDESPYKDVVHLQVYDPHTKEEIPIESTTCKDCGPLVSIEDGKKVIELRKRSFEQLEDGSARYKFLIKFVVDSTELNDLQYVIDSKTIITSLRDEGDDDAVDEDEIIDEGKILVEAIPRFPRKNKNGCNARRAYGKIEDPGLQFEVIIPAPALHKLRHDGPDIGIQMLGGWACGREAVKLTEPLYFILSSKDGETASTEKDNEL